MAILKPKRGSGLPTGLQQNELAIDILNKRIYLGNAGGTGDIVSSHITDYVISTNGATGAVTITGGTGISVVSPTGASRGITLINQGVISVNGSTGTIANVAFTNAAQTFTSLQSFSSGISSAGGTFTALTRFISGLSASGATFTGDVNFSALNGRIIANRQLDITGRGLYLVGASSNSAVPANTINLQNNGSSILVQSANGIINLSSSDAAAVAGITSGIALNTFYTDGLTEYYSKFIIGPSGPPLTNLDYIFNLPRDSGTIALTKNLVSSFNGLTGAVTGVASFNSATGAIQGVSTIVAGSGISVSGATGNVTITNIGVTGIQGGTGIAVSSSTGNPTIRNTGVISINGSTGTITNIAVTNAAQTFTGIQSFSAGLSASGGITFHSPILSTRLSRTSSVVFDTQTGNFSPAETDNGKVFVINISGKTTVTVMLDGLSTGWRAKFLVLGGSGVNFDSSLGTVLGTYGVDGGAVGALTEMVEVYCYGANTYFAG